MNRCTPYPPPQRSTRRQALRALACGAAGLVCAPGRLLAEGLSPAAAMDLALQAQELLAAGNAPAAIRALERALALAPHKGHSGADSIWMRGLLARAYMQTGRSQDALRELQTVLASRPDDATARIMYEQLQAVREAQPAEAAAPCRRVVLDPGHGGFDPGAVHNGLQEKDVVLDIARRTARIAERMTPPLKLQLTRSDDYFLPLDARAVTANWFEADLFVSLHANAHHDASANGLETYRCSERPTSARAAKVAARENSSPEEGAACSMRSFVDIEDILFRFERSRAWQAGGEAALQLQQGLAGALPLRDRGVHGANFAVLRSARMPAVLVETGFLSNPQEARLLASGEGRENVATALAQAISVCAGEGAA